MRETRSELHAQLLTARREWDKDGIPVLTASVELPAPEPTDRIALRIRRYYQLQSRAFLRYCEHQLLPDAKAACQAALAVSAPLPCFHAELTFQVTYNGDRLWSLYTQSRETTLPGRLLVRRWGDTWDLKSGYPLSLGDCFLPRRPWKRQLLSLAAEEIEARQRSGTAQYHEDWRRRLRRAFNPRNFYLTPEGLSFFFPMYAIAPAIERVPVFLLPCGTEGLWIPPCTAPSAEENTAAE